MKLTKLTIGRFAVLWPLAGWLAGCTTTPPASPPQIINHVVTEKPNFPPALLVNPPPPPVPAFNSQADVAKGYTAMWADDWRRFHQQAAENLFIAGMAGP